MKDTKQNKLISKYIDKNLAISSFYEKYIEEKYLVREYIEQKNTFLSIFTLRYEINTDINFLEIFGAKDLIENLSNSGIRKMKVIIYENEKGSIQFYMDINARMIHGCLLRINEQLVTEVIKKK
jgi:hypothetical protein